MKLAVIFGVATLGLVGLSRGQLDEAPIGQLLEQTKASDLQDRRDALYELVRRRDESSAVIQRYAELANERDEQLQFQALMGLARVGEKAQVAIPQLIEAIQDRSDQVRYRASVALGNIGESSIEPILKFWPDASSEQRVGLARALGIVGPKAKTALPVLQDALSADDEILNRYAAEAVVAIRKGDAAQENAFLELASHSSGAVRREGLKALAALSDPTSKVVARFTDALEDEDPVIREAAIIAVVRLSVDKKTQASFVKRSLLDPSLAVRAAGRAAIRLADLFTPEFAQEIGAELGRVGDVEVGYSLINTLGEFQQEAAPQLEAILDCCLRLELQPAQVSDAIARFGPQAIQQMMELLESKPQIAPFVSATLAKAGKSAKSVLGEGLSSDLVVMRRASAKAMGDAQLLDAELFKQLKTLAEDSHAEVRAAALRAIADLVSLAEADEQLSTAMDGVANIVTAAAKDTSALVRQACIENLPAFEIDTSNKRNMLETALKDAALEVRVAALSAAAADTEMGTKLVSEIVSAVEDPAEQVRAAALRSLAAIGEKNEEVARVVREGLRDSATEVRVAATNAVAALGFKDAMVVELIGSNLSDEISLLEASLAAIEALGKEAKSLTPTLANLLGHSEESIRLGAVTALASVESDKVQLANKLAMALEDDAWNVRQKAAQTLGELHGAAKEAVPKLFQLIGNEADESFATAAIREIDTAPVESIPLLLEGVQSEHFRTKYYAAYLLGKIGPDAKSALPKLREELQNAGQSRRSASMKKYLSQAIESIEGKKQEDE